MLIWTWRPLGGPFWWLVLMVIAATSEIAQLAPVGTIPGAACGLTLIGLLLFGAACVVTERVAGVVERSGGQ